MTNYFRSREGAVADDDVKTQLVTLGSQTAPGPLLVPGNATHLKAVYPAFVTSNEAAGQYASLFRLEGPGIKRGSVIVPAHAGGTAVATGTHTTAPTKRLPLNIEVVPGQEILVFAESLGVDMGTAQAQLTLEFGTEAGPEGEIKGEITVEVDFTAVDTLTRATTQGSVTTPSRLTPPDATMLKRIIYSVGSDAAADGEVTYLLRLLGDAIKGGEQTLTLGGESWIDVAAGGDGDGDGMVPMVLDNLDIEIAPNETLDISLEAAGVDVGTSTVIVSAHFA